MSTHQLHLEKHQQHTHHADMIPGVSISYQTALSKSILRLSVNPASALTIFPREPLWSQNHDTGSYDTVYQVDNSNKDVVIYFKSWTMTGIHVVPDRQQYDRHTPISSCKRRYDAWCKYFTLNRSFNEYSTTSRQPSIRADYSSWKDTSSVIYL